MKSTTLIAIAMLQSIAVFSQQSSKSFAFPVSVGTRNTISAFNSDKVIGKGIGGQFRVQLAKRVNSEWFIDYINSKTATTARNDYHIGWSLMFYGKNNYDFTKLFQPYLIVGHCFDNTQVFELNNKSNTVSRLSVATQAGLGTHINITPKLDCSLAGQYMLHVGKDIETSDTDGKQIIQKTPNTNVDGHLLFTVSFNYKLFTLR